MRGARTSWVAGVIAVVAGALGGALNVGCAKEEPAKNPPAATMQPSGPAGPAAPAAPAAPPAAAADGGAGTKPKMVANPDGLSLADRIAKREADEKKLAAQLAGDEQKRLIAYDKTKLPLHQQVFTAIKKFRAGYDKAKTKDDVEKVRAAQRSAIEATGKKMATIDPKGGNSNVTTDYDVMLNAIANDYPDALEASYEGDKKPLEEQTAELDKRTKKVEAYLAEVKAAKK